MYDPMMNSDTYWTLSNLLRREGFVGAGNYWRDPETMRRCSLEAAAQRLFWRTLPERLEKGFVELSRRIRPQIEAFNAAARGLAATPEFRRLKAANLRGNERGA